MATSNDQAGILIVFEADGCEWASHFRNLLDSMPYDIPTYAEHWWNLHGRDAMNYPVHVLVLTPQMEHNIRHEKLSYLRNDSVTSLLLECNVDSKKVEMPQWRVVETINVKPEEQRKVLTTLVEMYELATNDDGSFDPSEPIPIDIVPTCLYPGERTLYVMLNEEPQGEVTIKLEGVQKRLTTKKHTQNTYVCVLPNDLEGQKTISVYSSSGYSLYTTRIVIATPGMLMDNFIENLKDTLGMSIKSTLFKDWDTLCLTFNPFSEISFSKDKQVFYARLIEDIIKKSKPTERDSGLSDDLEDPNYSSIAYYDDVPSPGRLDKIEAPRILPPSQEHFTLKKSKSLGNFFKKLIRPKSAPEDSFYATRKKKTSRRSRMARSQNFFSVPDLPPENTIVFERRSFQKR